jgi:hypothetical protein
VVKVNGKILDGMLEGDILDAQARLPGVQAELPKKSAKYSFYVTKEPEKFRMVAQKLLGELFDSVTLISL